MSIKILKSEASVIKIIDQYKIVINKGIEHEVTAGDIVEVFEIGEEIIDPTTSRSLGTMDIIKDELLVTTVYPLMSICEKEKLVRNSTQNSLAAVTTNIFGTSETEPQKIKIDPEEISGGFEDSDTTIRIGDPVRIYTT
ncbi:hypothetical protein JZO86_15430 [Enterococcus ureasiticus]|uniref:hypothetical protein n=1 Tax=Enterococcus ureasiticus TaxID=903984 RepID=UPI001A8EDE84|nr:hypothetical protein [Enterococcus ureasiticus]MBO0475093.1 hypothetical protein [Enterococcus ureasiticus]